jgi:hypothetical protein
MWVALAALAPGAQAEQIKVRHPQGSAHGFVEVTTLDGTRIGIGDLLQRARGSTVSSELKLSFFDGSIDDETTVFSQRGIFRFVSDHHIQRGPSFPKPMDATIDADKGLVKVTDETGQIKQAHIDMPPDVYNGLASSMLMNVSPASPETRISIVLASAKPRIIHLSMTNAGEAAFTLGGVPRKAIDYLVHVELGGIAGVMAPVIGKQPLDYHVWIADGQDDPAFIREEGQLYEGGPVWRIQQISAAFPK